MTNSESSDCCLKSERDCFDVTLDKPWSGQLLRLPATLPLPGWGLKNISINKLCLGSKEHHYTNTHLSPECATNSQWSVISLLRNIQDWNEMRLTELPHHALILDLNFLLYLFSRNFAYRLWALYYRNSFELRKLEELLQSCKIRGFFGKFIVQSWHLSTLR